MRREGTIGTPGLKEQRSVGKRNEWNEELPSLDA
jgi:hypothetical protein